MEIEKDGAQIYLVKTAEGGLHVVDIKSNQPGQGKALLLHTLELAQQEWKLPQNATVYLDASGFKDLPHLRALVQHSTNLALRQYLKASCKPEDLKRLRREGLSWKTLAYARLGTQKLADYYTTLGFERLDQGDPYSIPMSCTLNKLLAFSQSVGHS